MNSFSFHFHSALPVRGFVGIQSHSGACCSQAPHSRGEGSREDNRDEGKALTQCQIDIPSQIKNNETHIKGHIKQPMFLLNLFHLLQIMYSLYTFLLRAVQNVLVFYKFFQPSGLL